MCVVEGSLEAVMVWKKEQAGSDQKSVFSEVILEAYKLGT